VRILTVSGVAAALAVAALGLSACGDSSPSEPVMDPSPTSQMDMPGGDPSTWTPVVLDDKTEGMFANVFVGQQGTVQVGSAVEIVTSDAAVVSVSQPTGGDFEAWGGFSAVAPGSARVVALDAQGNKVGAWTVNVAIKPMPRSPTGM